MVWPLSVWIRSVFTHIDTPLRGLFFFYWNSPCVVDRASPNKLYSCKQIEETSKNKVLTTKFGNFGIGDEDNIEAESKMKIVLKAEQELAKVRIGYDKDRQGSSRTRLAD